MDGTGGTELLITLFRIVVLVGGIILAWTLLALAWRILRADSGEWELNRKRYKHWLNPLTGKVQPTQAGRRDFRVRAGLALRKSTNTWEEQGILSDEAVNAVLRPGVKLKDAA